VNKTKVKVFALTNRNKIIAKAINYLRKRNEGVVQLISCQIREDVFKEFYEIEQIFKNCSLANEVFNLHINGNCFNITRA
jgi:hypothetical protein